MSINTPEDRAGQVGFVQGQLEDLCIEMLRRNIQPEHVVSALVALAYQIGQEGLNRPIHLESK
jgi:hypothetical protein